MVAFLALPQIPVHAQMMGGPAMIMRPGQQGPTLQDYAMASSGNNVYLAWTMQNPDNNNSLFFERSSDGGKTFGEKVLIANASRIDRPSITAAGNSVYLAWGSHHDDNSSIITVASHDGGATFASPVSINTGTARDFSLDTVEASGNNVDIFWTGLFGENRTQSVMVSQSTDGAKTFGLPVFLSDRSLPSNSPVVARSDSGIFVAWSSRQACPDPLGNCPSMTFFSSVKGGTVSPPVHLGSLDGLENIQVSAGPGTVLVEGLKRTYDGAVFENSTIILAKSHDGGGTFSTTSATYGVNMEQVFPVQAGNTLYQFWTVYENGLQPVPIYVARSTDGGGSFGAPEEVSQGTTPLWIDLTSSTAASGDSAYVAWHGTDGSGAGHIFLSLVGPQSAGRPLALGEVYQPGRFHMASEGSSAYLSFEAGQNIFFDSIRGGAYLQTGLLCPFVRGPAQGSVTVGQPQAMVDGSPATSVLTGWDVALSSEMHPLGDQSENLVYAVQATRDGNVAFHSEENFTVTCGYSPTAEAYWKPQEPGNYTVVASLLDPANSSVISSANSTVQVLQNNYLGNASSTPPVQFRLVNDSSNVERGGWAKFEVKAGPGSPNYRLHNIRLWIDGPQGVRAWFDKYSINSYDYTLDNLTLYVYVDSAAAQGINTLKIEGKGVAADLLNGTIFNVGNPMPPPGGSGFPNFIFSENQNGQQVGEIDVTVGPGPRPSTYAVVGPPTLHPVRLCSKDQMVNGIGGGTTCIGFIGYQEFPVTVYSSSAQDVTLGAGSLPNGTWFKFLPQKVTATPSGTQSRLVMAGALEPFEINVLSVKAGKIFANTTAGSSVAFLPLGRNENIQVLNGTSPIDLGSPTININRTTPNALGMVYDSTSGTLPVTLSVLGVEQGNSTAPMPDWLTVNFVPSSFALNYSQPYYIKMETGTHDAHSGANATVLVGEKIGGKEFTGKIKVEIPNPVYFGGMMSPISTAPRNGPVIMAGHGAGVPTHQQGASQCKAGLVGIDSEDGRHACVRPTTAKMLGGRGWGHLS